MSLSTAESAAVETPAAADLPAPKRMRVAAAFAVALALTAILAAVHLTQGTSSVGAADLLRLLFGGDDAGAAQVLVASRLPRLLAALVVGLALGVAGAGLQSLARNALASPDTIAVNAGAYLAVVAASAFGVSLGVLPSGALAFLGGLAAAGLVLALSSGGRAGPTRMILAGTAVALALGSLTTVLLLLFEQNTIGLYAWGNGSLVQSDLDAVTRLSPVVALGVVGLLLAARRLDILALGDDPATVLGVDVRRTRLLVVVFTVLLAAAAVTLCGPVGFVGLCAPVIVRLLAKVVPGVQRHAVLLPLSGIVGVLVVVGSDVLLRAAIGAQAGVEVPTGVVTSLFGAALLIWLARRHRDAGNAPQSTSGRLRSRGAFLLVLGISAALTVAAVIVGMLAGDTWVLLGDVVNWLRDQTGPAYTFVLDQRYPRVFAALLAGAALAVAGTTVQAVCRNPLAEPGLLGISAGAGVGAVILISVAPLASVWLMSGVAGAGALVAFAIVYGLAWRGGLSSDRLVLVGIGMQTGLFAVISMIIIATDPWNTGKALTWLSGSTYGRTAGQVVPVLVAIAIAVPLLAYARRDLDLLALDEDTPRVLGVRLERTRMVALVSAALLTSTAVSAVGVVGFVGLVAPHAARALVGGRHAR
ncbi:MAG TPA: iron ABC transporter permease, partial [Asanoa sp.]|nr:iron ABC transporter permease [Asanoa sp.]